MLQFRYPRHGVYFTHQMEGRQARTIEQAFGRVVQARRKQLGLSQEELGFRSGLHRTFISQIERGVKSPSLRTLQTLASALDTEAGALVGEAERMAQNGDARDGEWRSRR